MRSLTLTKCLVLVLIFGSCLVTSPAQSSANANTVYQQLRTIVPGNEVIRVKDLEIRRDAAVFTFQTGSFAFYSAVDGRVTGAVFRGQGHLHITPPTAEERHNLSILNNTEEFDEDFDQVVLRFTDTTADELRKASIGVGQPDSVFAKAGQELQTFLRRHSEGSYDQQGHLIYFERLYENLDLRLLEDVLSSAPGKYFFASIHGSKDAHLFYIYDPHGVDRVAPEEVALLNWDNSHQTAAILMAFHRAADYASLASTGEKENAAYTILNQELDVSIEKSGFLTVLATVELRANQDALAVIPLDLYPGLRVSQVSSAMDQPLDWIQEKPEDDPGFGVVLAAPVGKGQTTTVKIAYGGKDVVINEGSGNYYPYPIARDDWFPNSYQRFGDYASYHIIFHIPKGLQVVATGTRIAESSDGRIVTSEWKTDKPLPAAGFSLGEFTMKEDKVPGIPGAELTIDAYANTSPPDRYSDTALHDQMPHYRATDNTDFGRYQTGSIDTTKMLPVQLSEARVAASIYNDYFGPIPFTRVALTQQFACNYGQSWPMLVYLPICGFLDQTQQVALHIEPWDIYWKVVTPHEVSHQWWGNTVGFRSYRDQWMSEGFAQESASIFLKLTRPKSDDYLQFWQVEQRLLTERNAYGFRPIDVGPVTMGLRLNSPQTGFDVYSSLVYPKGAFILHMIQMMMWSPKDGDARFKATMQDFVATYRLQAATTEDFKAIVEKHMSSAMDLDHNGRLDWFFNEYVYGTDLPAYHFEGSATPNDEGVSVSIRLKQSSVPVGFKMLVPIYLEFADGTITRLGATGITGDTTIEKTVRLPKLPSAIKRVFLNYNYDVLCTEN